jgi:hypothetical protein
MDDNRLVLLALEKVEKKLERLTDNIREQGVKLDAIETAARSQARARRTLAGIFLLAVATLAWWALGDRITSTVLTAYRDLEVALKGNNPKPTMTIIESPVSQRSRR